MVRRQNAWKSYNEISDIPNLVGTVQNPCQLIFNLYIDAFLGNKMIPDIINHHFTRYWESDDLWVSYP